MKKYIKLASLTLALLTLLTLFVSCSDKAAYADDVAVKTIGDKLASLIPAADGYYAADEDYLGFYFEGAADIVDEHIIQFSATSTNINQFGIFHAKDGKAAELKTICDNYIKTMQDRWVAQAGYIASEHPKMENAEARVFGNYVVYVMLTPGDKAAAFSTVEKMLAK